MDMKALAALYIDSIKAVATELSRLKGWNLNSVTGALRCTPMVVKEVEKISSIRKLTGAEKNSLAVEFILRLVPLPWWFPESVARPMLEGFVSAVVDALKDRF